MEIRGYTMNFMGVSSSFMTAYFLLYVYLRFNDFEIIVMNHMMIVLSQLNSLRWAFSRFFNICVNIREG